MTSSVFKRIMIFTLIILFVTNIKISASATAIATVSANIVPISSISASGAIILTTQGNNKYVGTNSQYSGTPNISSDNNIRLSTLSSKDSLKFKISSSRNMTYDISISSTADMSDNKTEILLDNLHIKTTEVGPKHKEENRLVVNGSLLDNNKQKTNFYKGQAVFSINYN